MLLSYSYSHGLLYPRWYLASLITVSISSGLLQLIHLISASSYPWPFRPSISFLVVFGVSYHPGLHSTLALPCIPLLSSSHVLSISNACSLLPQPCLEHETSLATLLCLILHCPCSCSNVTETKINVCFLFECVY